MAKLKDLVAATAQALGDPEASVNVLAMELRKNGLIRSTGRGLHAAEMTPDDAASLLIACLSGGPVREASDTTARVGALPSTGIAKELRNRNHSKDKRENLRLIKERLISKRPILSTLVNGHQFSLALSSILKQYMESRKSLPFVYVSVENISGLYIAEVEFFFYYRRFREASLSYCGMGADTTTRGKTIRTRIDRNVLRAIADCLCGRDQAY